MSWKQIRAGAELARAGKTAEAVALIEEACKKLPSDPRAWVQLGLAQLEAQLPEAAQESLEKALALSPAHPPSLYYLVLAHSDQDNQSAAAAVLKQLAEVSPHNQALPTLRALLCLQRGEIDQALLHLEIPPCPTSPVWNRPELCSFGPLTSRLAVEIERWLLPLEIPLLQRSCPLGEPPAEPPRAPDQLGPDRVRSALFGMLGGIAAGAATGAALRFLLVLLLGSDFEFTVGVGWTEPIVWMGSLLGVGGAAWGFLSPSLPWHFRAYLAKFKGERLLEKALGEDSTHQRRQYFMLGIQEKRRVLMLDPSLLRSHYGLGEALLFCASSLRDNRYLAEAEQCFLHSWRQDGENPYLNYYLARCCQLQGKVQAALAYYTKAIAKFSKLSEAHFGLGQCQLLLGDNAQARSWFKRALGSELQLARDRLHDLAHAYGEGLLSRRLPWPMLPDEEPQPLEEKEPGATGVDLPLEEEATAASSDTETTENEPLEGQPQNSPCGVTEIPETCGTLRLTTENTESTEVQGN